MHLSEYFDVLLTSVMKIISLWFLMSVFPALKALKGISYFKEMDLEQQHEIILVNYRKISADKKHSDFYYWMTAILQYVVLFFKMSISYKYLKDDYACNIEKIKCVEYWKKQLEI